MYIGENNTPFVEIETGLAHVFDEVERRFTCEVLPDFLC